MKLPLQGVLTTAAVALAAGFGGVWLGTKVFAPATNASLHDVVHDRLDLTADQRAQIESLETAFAARKRTLELEMNAANAELAAAIHEEGGYGPGVTTAVDRCHDAMGRLQTETIAHMFAMREVLNEEQKAIFDATVVDALTAEPQ